MWEERPQNKFPTRPTANNPFITWSHCMYMIVMTSHDACASGTSRVLTVIVATVEDGGSYSSSRRLWNAVFDKIFECTEHNADRNLSTVVPAVIPRFLFHKIVTEYLLFRKLCIRWVPKQLAPEHKAKRMESPLTIMCFIISYTSRNSYPATVSIFRITEGRRWE